MPEAPEVRIMSDFINFEVGHQYVDKVEKSPISKNKCDLSVLDGKRWKVESYHRGKEMMLVFSCEEEKHFLKINFAKIASLEIFEGDFDKDYFNRRAMLRLYAGTKIYSISDFTRYVIWRWSDNWDPSRSPDLVSEHNDWRDHLYAHRKIPYFKRPIFNLLTDQRFFNGVGNFARSEILARTRFSPFLTLNEVLSSEILRTDFFETCRYVLDMTAVLGGMQFKHWKNPFGCDNKKFNRWVRCYNKPRKAYYMKDTKGAKFWFEKRYAIDYVEWAMAYDDLDTSLPEKIYKKIKNQQAKLR